MREILFRGKRIDNGEWVEGAFLNDRDGSFYICPAASDISVSYGDNGRRMRIGCWYNVDPSTVGQYTGLTDKNGKRIFEGDICQTKGIPLIDEKPFVAVWNDYYIGFYWENIDNPRETDMFTQTVAELTEVIGTIHDNPELLKEEPT